MMMMTMTTSTKGQHGKRKKLGEDHMREREQGKDKANGHGSRDIGQEYIEKIETTDT